MDTKILLVDDSKMQLHLTEKMLVDLGYKNIETALSVDAAKEVLVKQQIDLIFSDWHMPGASGLDFVKYIRATKKFSAIPFIMVTTEHEKSNIFEAAKAGIQNYVFKPVSKDILKKKLYDLAKTYSSINPPQEAM
jgi:CheY-like chemotaxis protein